MCKNVFEKPQVAEGKTDHPRAVRAVHHSTSLSLVAVASAFHIPLARSSEFRQLQELRKSLKYNSGKGRFKKIVDNDFSVFVIVV